uniref:Uncharacterized protein n=1 Tax=Hyaloperonospora arabidopsidis (strain Emoy2) TaxID=559515 RepID=M4C4R9_HYAAE
MRRSHKKLEELALSRQERHQQPASTTGERARNRVTMLGGADAEPGEAITADGEEASDERGTEYTTLLQCADKETEKTPRQGVDLAHRPRLSSRARKQSQRLVEAENDTGTDDKPVPERKKKGPPIIAVTGVRRPALTQLLAMLVLGSGEERYVDLPDRKTHKACAKEIASLEANKTWDKVQRTTDIHLLRSK